MAAEDTRSDSRLSASHQSIDLTASMRLSRAERMRNKAKSVVQKSKGDISLARRMERRRDTLTRIDTFTDTVTTFSPSP